MSGKDGGGATSKKGNLKTDGEEGDDNTMWLPDTTVMDQVKAIVGDEKYDEMLKEMESAMDDTQTLFIINAYLSESLDIKTGNNVTMDKVKQYHMSLDGTDELASELASETDQELRLQLVEKLATKMVLSSHATTAVVAFARNSYNQPTLRSQVTRVVESFPKYKKYKYQGETHVLHPCGITGKFINVSKQGYKGGMRKYVQHYNTLYDTVQSLVKGGKKVIVTMLDIDRLHRDPAVALRLADELEALGDVQVKPMRTFEYSMKTVLDTAIKIADEKAKGVGDKKSALHRDAAFGLRDALKENKQQKVIDDEFDNYLEEVKSGTIDLEESPFIKEACTEGNEIVKDFVYDKGVWDPILGKLRDGVSNAEARKMARDYIDDHITQTKGKQNTRGALQRSSETTTNNQTERKYYINTDNAKHPESQLAKNLIYLHKFDKEVCVPELISRSDDDSDGDGKQSSASVAIISVNALRRQNVIREVLAIVEKIAKKEVHSLVVTITTRLSGYGGYIRFIKAVCDETGTKFIMTECMGIDHIEIADEEDKRAEALEESLPNLIRDKFAPETDIGKAMLNAANRKSPQVEDKTEWIEMKKGNKRKGQGFRSDLVNDDDSLDKEVVVTKKKARTKEKAAPPKKNKDKKAPPKKKASSGKKAIPIDISVGKKPPPNEEAPSGKKKGKPEVTPATKKKTSKKYDDDSDDMDFEAEEEHFFASRRVVYAQSDIEDDGLEDSG